MTLKLHHRKTINRLWNFIKVIAVKGVSEFMLRGLFPLAAVEGTAVSPLLTRAHPVIAGGYPEAVCVQKHACQL